MITVSAYAEVINEPVSEPTLQPREMAVSWPALQALDYPPQIGLDPDNLDHRIELLMARIQAEELAVLERDDRIRYIEWLVASEYAQDVADARAAAAQVFSATSGAAGERYYQGGGYCSVEFLSQFGFNDVYRAARICNCESSGNANAKNGQYDGIFQLSDHHTSQAGGNDPSTQARYVANLTNREGWGQWQCQ